MSEYDAELEQLVRTLGGGWRVEHGVMPVVVLTIVEARKLAARVDEADAQRWANFTTEELRAIFTAFDVADGESMVDISDDSPALALWRSVWDELEARGAGTGRVGDARP